MTRLAPTVVLLTLACNGGETDTDPDTDTDTTVQSNTIVDIAASDDRFDTLVQAVTDAGLVELLSSDGTFTVFAPTDEAFEDAGIDLSAVSASDLETILTYHVIAGAAVDSGSIPPLADSAAGFTLFFDTSDGVMVNDAEVRQADIIADNGVIHVVDKVLLPPTILDAAGYAGLTGLAGAVGAADPGVATLLDSPGTFTVFAPTNEAFDDISGVTLSQAELTDVLTYHVLASEVPSTDIPAIADSALQNTYGIPVSLLFDTSSAVMVNDAEVRIADIYTTNGVVHVIDKVLLPLTVVDLASHAGMTGLLDAVGAASGDLGTTLSGTGPFTVFAPTNDAFDDVASVTATLTADELRDVLLFHVVGGSEPVKSSDLTSGEVPSLLTGQTLTVDASALTVEGANIVLADVHGTNGTVHVISAVMIPPSE